MEETPGLRILNAAKPVCVSWVYTMWGLAYLEERRELDMDLQ
jgi:hypothetical protein